MVYDDETRLKFGMKCRCILARCSLGNHNEHYRIYGDRNRVVQLVKLIESFTFHRHYRIVYSR